MRRHSASTAVLFFAMHSILSCHSSCFSWLKPFLSCSSSLCCRGNTAVARPYTKKEYCKKVLSSALLNDTIQTTWGWYCFAAYNDNFMVKQVHHEIQLAYYSGVLSGRKLLVLSPFLSVPNS